MSNTNNVHFRSLLNVFWCLFHNCLAVHSLIQHICKNVFLQARFSLPQHRPLPQQVISSTEFTLTSNSLCLLLMIMVSMSAVILRIMWASRGSMARMLERSFSCRSIFSSQASFSSFSALAIFSAFPLWNLDISRMRHESPSAHRLACFL